MLAMVAKNSKQRYRVLEIRNATRLTQMLRSLTMSRFPWHWLSFFVFPTAIATKDGVGGAGGPFANMLSLLPGELDLGNLFLRRGERRIWTSPRAVKLLQ